MACRPRGSRRPGENLRRLYKSTPGCFEHAVSGQRAALDPQPLSRQQRLTLIGLDPSLQRLVGCIQPLIGNISFRLYALDNFQR